MIVSSPPLGPIRNRLIPTSSTSDQWNSRVGRSQTGVSTGGEITAQESFLLLRRYRVTWTRRRRLKTMFASDAESAGAVRCRLGHQPLAEARLSGRSAVASGLTT